MNYDMLFEKGRIGTLVLKNRGIMMPMATDLADKNGIVTPRQIRYYQERAKGGIGMIINEYTGVDDVDSIPSIHNLRIARDYHISEMEKLTDAVHLYGCKIAAQIHHGGATSNPNFTGRQNLAPSAVPIADGRPVPKEMTLEDIKRVEQKFIDAAVRCQKAGYDAVELLDRDTQLKLVHVRSHILRQGVDLGQNPLVRAGELCEIHFFYASSRPAVRR